MSTTDSTSTDTAPPTESGMTAKDPHRRRRALWIVAALFVLAGVAWVLLDVFVFSTRVTTDNAYVGGNQVAISAQVPGTVTAILTDDTQHVSVGQPLVKLDSTDAQIRLSQAASALAQAVRQVRQQTQNAAASDAAVAARRIDVTKAQADLKRRLPLVSAQAESPEVMQHLRDGVAQAQAALEAAQAQSAAAHAAIAGTAVADNPAVQQARAQFRAAWVAAGRNTIVAPVAGYVIQRSVQLGNSVQPGQHLMTVVPLAELWIDANFKESQLRHVRIGQPAAVETDLYGGSVTFHGKVVGLGAGTGAAFSLLPAQNATGNWIKVVQRVPVRIALDARELARHPLRVGLSTAVTVDIRDDSGAMLSPADATAPAAQTKVYEHLTRDADAEAARIIDANLDAAAAQR